MYTTSVPAIWAFPDVAFTELCWGPTHAGKLLLFLLFFNHLDRSPFIQTTCPHRSQFRRGASIFLDAYWTHVKSMKTKRLWIWIWIWILDPRLNFADHIERLAKKVKQRIGSIKRVQKYISKNVALILYKAIVLPVCDLRIYYIWWLLKTTFQDWISFRITLVIFRKNRYTNGQAMLTELSLPHLCAFRKFYLACNLYQTINGQIKSVEFVLMFELIDDIWNRVTCANTSGNLVVPKYRTGFGGRPIMFMVLYFGMLSLQISSCLSH